MVLAGAFRAFAMPACAPPNTKVVLTSTNLPIVWIQAPKTINQNTRVTATIKIIDNGEGLLNYADTVAYPGQHIDFEGYIGLRYRGNSSYLYSDKKPYSFRPLDKPLEEGGEWKKASILGMPRDSKWALLAPYADKSMIRDMLAFEISRPWMDYTPQGRYCEVIYNGVYHGVYVLTEVVSGGKNRLNLDDPGEEGDELTGGYLLEVDRNDEVTFRSKYPPVLSDGTPITGRYIEIQYKSPEYEDLTKTQVNYIRQRVNAMEAALASDHYRDSVGGYRDYLDEMSFIDYQIAMELGHNVDGYRMSGKFFKWRDSVDPRFKMVLWDMNLAYGNSNYNDGWRYDTWQYQINDIIADRPTSHLVPFWWYRLNTDEAYVQHLKDRWAQYRRANIRTDRLMATVDSLVNLITVGGAEERNSLAYPTWGEYVWPNYYIAVDYDDEIAHLKQWLLDRLAWMDEQLDFVPDPVVIPGDVNGDGEVNIADINVVIDFIMGNRRDDMLPGVDVNGDGEVNVADVNVIITIILAC